MAEPKCTKVLLACGANAFNVLATGAPPTAAGGAIPFESRLKPVKFGDKSREQAADDSVKFLWAGLVQSCFQLTDTTLHIAGHGSRKVTLSSPPDGHLLPQQRANASLPPFTSPVGDHTGLQALLHRSGLLLTTSSNTSTDPAFSTPDGPLLGHLARTAAGATVAIPYLAPAATVHHLLSWPSFSSFLAWHASPTSSSHAPTHAIRGGAPAQLVASTTAFALRTVAGEVYTWGDGRHTACLGRASTAAMPASEAHQPPDLTGLRIVHIAAAQGGWTMGAVSEAGDAWIWGFDGPGVPEGERWVAHVGDEAGPDMYHIALPSDADVVKLALGATHALVLDANGVVWGMGRDSRGQLGFGNKVGVGCVSSDVQAKLESVPLEDSEARTDVIQRDVVAAMGRGEVVKTWQQIRIQEPGYRVVDIAAGDLSSFVTLEPA